MPSPPAQRLREVTSTTTRRFLGDGFSRITDPSGYQAVRVEIFAFGERVAFFDYSTPAGAFAPPLFDPELPAWLVGLAPALALAWLLALGVRGGLLVGVARRPGAAGVAAVLVVALVLPVPATGGGGGYPVGVFRWVLSDRLGSGVVVIDEDGGLIRHTRFRPFGAVDAEAGPGAMAGRTYFAGHPRQEETGLLQMQARWMNPATGTFVSVDPIARAGQPERLNGYSYVSNNPISLIDPTGMEGDTPRPRASFYSYTGRGGSIFTLAVGSVDGPSFVGFMSPAEYTLAVAGAEAAASAAFAEFLAAGRTATSGGLARLGLSGSDAAPDVGSLPAGSGLPWGPLDYRTANELLGQSQGPSSARAGVFENPILNLFGKIFALPYTAIASVVGILAIPFGAKLGFGNNAIQVLNFPLIDRVGTIGNVVFYPTDSLPRDYAPLYGWYRPINLGLHEMAHTLQYQALGPFFLPVYLLAGGAFGGSSPFELAANRFADGGGSFLP